MKGGSFARGTAKRIGRYVEKGLQADELALKPGLLQGLDPRAKIVGLLSLTVSAAWTQRLYVFVVLIGLALVLAVFSHISTRVLALRVWLGVLLFTGVIALPALFIVPGEVVYHVPLLHWGITAQGIRSAAFLIARAVTAATFPVLLILTTPWMRVLKGLRVLRVPVVIVVILSMTYRYIVLFLDTAHEMFEARESRTIGKLARAERRRLATAAAGVLLSKTLLLTEEVYSAMRSRGYSGEVYLLDDLQMSARDWAAMGLLSGCAVLVMSVG